MSTETLTTADPCYCCVCFNPALPSSVSVAVDITGCSSLCGGPTPTFGVYTKGVGIYSCTYTGSVGCPGGLAPSTLAYQNSGSGYRWEISVSVGAVDVFQGHLNSGPSPLGTYTKDSGCATSLTVS